MCGTVKRAETAIGAKYAETAIFIAVGEDDLWVVEARTAGEAVDKIVEKDLKNLGKPELATASAARDIRKSIVDEYDIICMEAGSCVRRVRLR
jgi:hypothetical protein